MLFVLLSAAPTLAQNAPTLDWELVNPFRFIRNQDVIDELKNVYKGLPPGKETAYNLEREMQRRSDAAVDKIRGDAKGCDNPQSPDVRAQCFAPYLGWLAKLAEGHHAGTCWDSENRRFREDGGCEGYIHPRSHKVRVWINNPQLLAGRVPQWFVDNQPLTDVKNCDDKHQKAPCVEFDVEYDSAERVGKEVSVRFADGGLAVAPINILVKDKLIVGLGDSYASGEGNPDKPAYFTEGREDPDFLYETKYFLTKLRFKTSPRKDKDSEVEWLDRRCHRSMYSYQFKTALQLALSKPRQAVTYVSYSCSGATTDNIIDKKQRENEGVGRVGKQLEALREVLRDGNDKPREIDYLLLSTGGNDIGFGRFVAYIVTTGPLHSIVAAGLRSKDLAEKSPVKIKEKLLLGDGKKAGNYPRLHDALLNERTGIRIKDCRSNAPCERILLTPYPNIFNDQNEVPCNADRQEFDIPFKSADRRGRLELVRQYVYAPLNDIQLNQIPPRLGWTVVKDHLAAYRNHGFCAQNSQSTSKTGEQFVMPILENAKWSPFDPWEYRAYEARQRWVRLPLDSKLTTDQVIVVLKRIKLDFFFKDDSSNIMHPTAEGHATNADANLKEILRIEGESK